MLLKRFLDYRGIAYDEVNVEDKPEEQRRLEEWTGGYQTVPTVQIGERILINPRGWDVEAALAEIAALKSPITGELANANPRAGSDSG